MPAMLTEKEITALEQEIPQLPKDEVLEIFINLVLTYGYGIVNLMSGSLGDKTLEFNISGQQSAFGIPNKTQGFADTRKFSDLSEVDNKNALIESPLELLKITAESGATDSSLSTPQMMVASRRAFKNDVLPELAPQVKHELTAFYQEMGGKVITVMNTASAAMFAHRLREITNVIAIGEPYKLLKYYKEANWPSPFAATDAALKYLPTEAQDASLNTMFMLLFGLLGVQGNIAQLSQSWKTMKGKIKGAVNFNTPLDHIGQWGANVAEGYIVNQYPKELSEVVTNFIDAKQVAGKKVVLVSFASMSYGDPKVLTRVLVEGIFKASEKNGQQYAVVMIEGGKGIDANLYASHPDVLTVEFDNQYAMSNVVDGTITSAGSGSHANALATKAELVSIFPFIADQRGNGEDLVERGFISSDGVMAPDRLIAMGEEAAINYVAERTALVLNNRNTEARKVLDPRTEPGLVSSQDAMLHMAPAMLYALLADMRQKLAV